MLELGQLQKWPSLVAPRGEARLVLAGLLVRASDVLARLAAGLAIDASGQASEPFVEFHAEAGAPEGALYVDGKLVGWIAGVSRL